MRGCKPRYLGSIPNLGLHSYLYLIRTNNLNFKNYNHNPKILMLIFTIGKNIINHTEKLIFFLNDYLRPNILDSEINDKIVQHLDSQEGNIQIPTGK